MLHSPAFVSYPLLSYLSFLTPFPQLNYRQSAVHIILGQVQAQTKGRPPSSRSDGAVNTAPSDPDFRRFGNSSEGMIYHSPICSPDVMHPAAEYLYCACPLPPFCSRPTTVSGTGCNRSRLDKTSSRCPLHPQGSYRICFAACCCKRSYRKSGAAC